MDRSKLEVLRDKEAALKAAIAAERVKQQQRLERDNARLASIIGTMLVDKANSSPELKAMITEILDSNVTHIPSRVFLAERGWL